VSAAAKAAPPAGKETAKACGSVAILFLAAHFAFGAGWVTDAAWFGFFVLLWIAFTLDQILESLKRPEPPTAQAEGKQA
jgi:hypothetical protein